MEGLLNQEGCDVVIHLIDDASVDLSDEDLDPEPV